jgi:hypothetical protein
LGILARALGLFILATWIGGATWFLVEQKAHGESLILPLVILGLGILTAAGLIGMTLQKVVPGWQRPSARAPAVVTVVLAAVSLAGIYLAVDTSVENQRPGGELTAALAPACRGEAVPGAAAVSTNGAANHLVVLDSSGDEVDWTGHPAIELRPPNLADAELVVCVEPEATRTQIQVCQYTNGPAITRYASSRKVEVRAASTGAVVMAFTATAEPRACRETESKDLTELIGTLDWQQVAARLWYLVAWGADPASVIGLWQPIVLNAGPLTEIGLIVENDGALPLSADVLLAYPGEDGQPSVASAEAEDMAPGELRIVSWSLADFDIESATAPRVNVGIVTASEGYLDRLATGRKLELLPPELPAQLDEGSIEIRVRNTTSVKMTGYITIGFVAGLQLLAIAEGQIDGIPAGATNSVRLPVTGDPTGANSSILQVDSAFETE